MWWKENPLLRLEPGSGHVEFMMNKEAVGQVFSEYFDLSCQFLFY
jgi:hypothetical protein